MGRKKPKALLIMLEPVQDGMVISGVEEGRFILPADALKDWLDCSAFGVFFPYELHIVKGRGCNAKYDEDGNVLVEFTRMQDIKAME